MHTLQKVIMLTTFLFAQAYCCRAQDMPDNQLIRPAGSHTIPFRWLQQPFSPQAAMLIPVTLNGCPGTFYMQFDTGSPYSMFYGNQLKSIRKAYPQALRLTDTTTVLLRFGFTAGNMPVLAKAIPVRPSGGADTNGSEDTISIIGTLGTDLIDNKVMEIDYPGRCMTITDDTTREAGPAWSAFMYVRRSILLPAAIKGTPAMLCFDTGSSAFALLTSKETAISLAAPGATQITVAVSSWGNTLTAVSIRSDDSIRIGSRTMPVRTVTYMEGVSENQVSTMKKLGIGGMTGNSLFADKVLLIDTRTKKFCIL
ncbi:hypothetical protein ECE50_008660 [Chitinophaga sp. Mgbs1]|uniref:Uncharacterized protein n=1 Tax=Chitinophaga solisilvae TaxID=1233460 RepID=A0A3S1D609_9BACT|nr:hypothetical protein [Chitinophaga solisilvae]